ncbi:uracil-DNA glycosylase family protein [Inhella sp.]|uniref:uracil-DNA glycosylase family protein n=1 Tax=Inhella sp. TaxID=1921806 RepID=UPI0035B20CBA
MKPSSSLIESFFEVVPAHLHGRSGKVFYSGRSAFERPAALYIVGVNPGGHPDEHQQETIGSHSERVFHTLPANWSAYRSESWEGHRPGTFGMAPQVLHMLGQLGLPAEAVPSSNLVFVRSRSEADLAEEFDELANECWPFHHNVISKLRPRVILCLGTTAGRYVRNRLGAVTQIAEFQEINRRKWTSRVHVTAEGIKVATVTHPSRADWRNPAADPSALIKSAIS